MLGRLLKRFAAFPMPGQWLGSRALHRGVRFLEEGNTKAAENSFRRALAHCPRLSEAHRQLGRLCAQTGRLEAAEQEIRASLELEPSHPKAWADMANVLQMSGRKAESLRHYRRALEFNPENALAWNNLGLLQRDMRQTSEARDAFREALRWQPRFVDALRNLMSTEPQERDERLLERLVREHPDHGFAHAALGYLLLKRRFDARRGLEEIERAVELGFADADLYMNRGISLQDLGRVPEAIESYERAIALDPAHRLARWHRSLALLLLGRYAEAWDDYEIRLEQIDPPPRPFRYPRWGGEEIGGTTLLVHAEQGLGDEIMFASCLPDVLQRARRCVIECHPKLEGLFRRSFPGATVHGGPQNDDVAWCAGLGIDLQVPTGSLPRLLRRSSADFPEHRGYLRADPDKVAAWRSRLAALGSGPKVGLSWRGGTARSRKPLRTLRLEQLLAALPRSGLQFINLQYDADPQEIAEGVSSSGIAVQHWPDAIDDYEETAALVSALDLTVTVCTAIVHLAGALGRPVWVLAPFTPEWRYGASGETMPWYPSARVLRQPVYGDWDSVLRRAATELQRRF